MIHSHLPQHQSSRAEHQPLPRGQPRAAREMEKPSLSRVPMDRPPALPPGAMSLLGVTAAIVARLPGQGRFGTIPLPQGLPLPRASRLRPLLVGVRLKERAAGRPRAAGRAMPRARIRETVQGVAGALRQGGTAAAVAANRAGLRAAITEEAPGTGEHQVAMARHVLGCAR